MGVQEFSAHMTAFFDPNNVIIVEFDRQSI